MKKLCVSAVAVALACSLSACKKSPGGPDGEEPSPSYDESNRIAWSGAPLSSAGCAGVANTWTWAITVTENNGVGGMTIDYLDWKFDGVAQPRQNINANLNGRGSVTVQRSACHSSSAQHVVEETLVSSYKGQQSNVRQHDHAARQAELTAPNVMSSAFAPRPRQGASAPPPRPGRPRSR